MYNVSFVCTYTEELDNNKKNEVYRDNFLDLLGLEIFDEAQATERMAAIVNDVGSHAQLKAILAKSAARYMSEDPQIGLMLMFSFDSMHLIHPCLVDLYRTADITPGNLEAVHKFLNME